MTKKRPIPKFDLESSISSAAQNKNPNPKSIRQTSPRKRWGRQKRDHEERKTDRAFQCRSQKEPDHFQEFSELIAPLLAEKLKDDRKWILNRYLLNPHTAGGRSYGLPPDFCFAFTKIVDRLRMDFGKKLPSCLVEFSKFDWLSEEELREMYDGDHPIWKLNVDALVESARSKQELTEVEMFQVVTAYILKNFERRWQLVCGIFTEKNCSGGFDSAIRTAKNSALLYRTEAKKMPLVDRRKYVRHPGWSEEYHKKEIDSAKQNGIYRLVQIQANTCGEEPANV